MGDIFNNYFNVLTKNLLTTLQTPDRYLNKLALSAIAIVFGIFVHWPLKKLISKYIKKDIKKKFKPNKVIKNGITILTALLVLFIWIKAINALVLIALLGAGLTIIMLRGLTHNIIGFFVIKRRKYFKEDFRVEIDGIIGDVVDINPINFTLLEVRNWLSSDSNTGRIIQVPNSIIFEKTMKMINPESRFIQHEIKYTLAFDSNWEKAEKIMREVGNTYYKEV